MNDARHEPDLTGRVVVIAGGTGAVGEGIVESWLMTGATVIVPTRTEVRRAEFLGLVGARPQTERLVVPVADYSTSAGATSLARRLAKEHGSVTDVVATIGSWWSGEALASTSREAWDEYFTGYATTHLALAQAFLPRLGPDGAYHVIIGGSALFPVPGSGIVSMQQAALLMMGKVLQEEHAGQQRVFTHVLGPVRTRQRRHAPASFVGARDVGSLTVALSADPRVESRGTELLNTEMLQATVRDVVTGVRA